MVVCCASTSETPLLGGDTVEGMVDYEGRRVIRSKSGGWRSAIFIIGVEMAERGSYYGISSNLISYLTGPLGQSTATAAANMNAWSGAVSMLPLLGGFVADAYLGRFRTILFASLLYILGLGLLTTSVIHPSPSLPHCQNTRNHSSCPPSQFQIFFFFGSLYLVALAQGGHKPCVQAFGADQFDGRNPEECKCKSSFFNWWVFGVCSSTFISVVVLSYIQDNLNWVLGFGIPCISMAAALVVFLLGMKTYRYSSGEAKINPFLRIAQVFVVAARNWHTTPTVAVAKEEEARGVLSQHGIYQFKFLDKALATVSDDQNGSDENWKICSSSQVEEARVVLNLVPIWATCLMFAVVSVQCSTFFVKQGYTMNRSIMSGFEIPPASLISSISLSVVVFIPIYDCIIVPIARAYTKKPSGITMLQRIGIGMFLSVISMVVAAVVEKKRLKVARDSGLVDIPQATLPMRVWWLVPQYVLFGLADVFTLVGLQEFFYDQMPNGLRSMGLSLYLSIFGMGNFLSSFLIAVIEKATSRGGQVSWFANNLNQAHLDWFYFLLAGLSAVEFAFYLYFAKSYIYNKGGAI